MNGLLKKPEFWLTAVFGVCALVVAGATIVTTVQLGRIATLADDVRNTNTRVDEVYPSLVSQASDIGSIRGSLEVSAEKIAAVSESLASMVPRLDAAVAAQEAQAQNIEKVTAAIGDLTKAVAANQTQLDAIASDVGKLKEIGFSPLNFTVGTYALAPSGFDQALMQKLTDSGIKVINVDGWASWDDVATAAAKSNLPIGNVWLGTSDPNAVDAIVASTPKR